MPGTRSPLPRIPVPGGALPAFAGRRAMNRAGDGNITPLINIIFLLLLYFMVAGQVAVAPDSALTLPVAASRLESAPGAPQLILAANGEISYLGRPLSRGAIAVALTAGRPVPVRVVLRADARAEVTHVVAITQTLAAMGVRELDLLTVVRPGIGAARPGH